MLMNEGGNVMTDLSKTLEELCADKGMRMTDQRRVIARILQESDDHPDVEELYRRSAKVDPRISLSTVYRTVKLFEDQGIIEKHDFRDGRSRYETVPREHHDHMIDVESGTVVEFHSPEIEALQERIAREHGFRLVGHRLELYGVPLDKDDA
ncbi:transcriptional repressor [Pseudorhizobium endolithicum]|uniref:Ferric uptake regulation protein n=2 Tax=Pseudorhizobium endolithicum TaxID=1191678 RepID=A0ABN7JWV3_9HYPH|nr:transcriptional repressor [Rhizobium sp. Q54]CAD7052091.1 transcriptional repressor [Pseudorhizobium endolithicum]